MKLTVIILTILIFCLELSGLASAQTLDTLWTKTYGGAFDDKAYCIRQTPKDDGYIIVGYSESYGAGGKDVYLIKTDENGDTLWTRTYGGIQDDFGNCVQLTPDDGYIIVGYTFSFGYGEMDVWLIKTDSHGDTLWTKTFGGVNYDRGYSVEQTTDGGYIISGFTDLGNTNNLYLIKTDENGDTLWTRFHGGNHYENGHCVLQTSDGGYISTGFTFSFGLGVPWRSNVYLIKTDSNGDTLWTRNFGGSDDDEGWVVQETSDDGFIIIGDTWSFQPGNSYMYLIKTDINGNVLWTKLHGGPHWDQGFCVQQTLDNGYILTGRSCPEAWQSDVYLVKANENGDSTSIGYYGGSLEDCGHWVGLTSDNGYIIAGYTKSFGEGECDVYIIRVAADQTNVEDETYSMVPHESEFSKNYPNPFNAATNPPPF